MSKSTADRDRWLALGLLVAVVALAYAVLIHPWWTVPMQAAHAHLEALQQRELRQRMQLQQAPQIAQLLERVREQQGGSPGFIMEPNAELATASLIQRLETAVIQASPGNRGCAITNRSPLQADTRERYVRVVVQVRLRCGTPELAAVLHSLESGEPRLFVGNLNILAQRIHSASGGLDVSFDLYGYLSPAVEVSRAN